MHYVLGEAYEDRKADYFFLMKQGGKDVHRIHKSCIQSPATKPVPCDVMSGDFHGNGEHHNWFERVDAALLDDCEKIDNECVGKYKDEDDEKGYLLDGSVYVSDNGATVGKKSAPSEGVDFFINDYGSDISLTNTVIGQPVNLTSDSKYKKLKFKADSPNGQDKLIQFNNNSSDLIDKDGKITANVYLSKGKLKIEEWDAWSSTFDLQPAKPCSTSQYSELYSEECAICDHRAMNASGSIASLLQWVHGCLESPLTTIGRTVYDCDAVGGTGFYQGVYSSTWYYEVHPCDCGHFWDSYDYCNGVDSDAFNAHGYLRWRCGEVWDGTFSDDYTSTPWQDRPQETAKRWLQEMYTKDEFSTSNSFEQNLQLYYDDCYNDCDKGTNTFANYHPNSSSCRDSNYSSDNGRLPDSWQACGAKQDVGLKIPMNKSS